MNLSQPIPARTAGRLRSLDIFRGMLIVAMILVNNPGPAVQVYPPLVHAEWDGCDVRGHHLPELPVDRRTRDHPVDGQANRKWKGALVPARPRRPAVRAARRVWSFRGGLPQIRPCVSASDGRPAEDCRRLPPRLLDLPLDRLAGSDLALLGIFALYLGLMVTTRSRAVPPGRGRAAVTSRATWTALHWVITSGARPSATTQTVS